MITYQETVAIEELKQRHKIAFEVLRHTNKLKEITAEREVKE